MDSIAFWHKLIYQVSGCFPFGTTWSDMIFAVDWVFRIKHPLCCLVSFRNPDGRLTYLVPQRGNPRNQLNKWKASIHLCEVECMPWCLIINLYDSWLWIDNSVAVCLTQRTETAGASHSTVVRTCQLAVIVWFSPRTCFTTHCSDWKRNDYPIPWMRGKRSLRPKWVLDCMSKYVSTATARFSNEVMLYTQNRHL